MNGNYRSARPSSQRLATGHKSRYQHCHGVQALRPLGSTARPRLERDLDRTRSTDGIHRLPSEASAGTKVELTRFGGVLPTVGEGNHNGNTSPVRSGVSPSDSGAGEKGRSASPEYREGIRLLGCEHLQMAPSVRSGRKPSQRWSDD